MATRLKTVIYAFPALASLTNNTLTNLTQITIYLPETGTKTFRSVVAKISMDDIITATGGTTTTKTFGLRVGAAGYTNVANANTLSNTGENLSLFWAVDYTSHFVTNWSGASMTCDFQVTVNQSTGTTLGMVNVCVTLEITYEYDDTASTHVKTVLIPLDAPPGAIPASATTYGTLPALDTYLPEASKTYRQILVVVQGNEHRNGATTDHTLTINVGATAVTTGNYEGALASDRWYRYVADFSAIATNTAHNFQLTASVTRAHHPQCYAIVTYEFDPASSTRVMNCQMLPMEVPSPMGGTTSADYQRAVREAWIPEPGTINNVRVAFFTVWTQAAAIGGLNMRIGTGSFVAYTDLAAQVCGGNGAMVRNDSAFTLARGRNELNFDVYRTDTADFGYGISGFWIINYQSDKASAGVGAHSHTVLWNIYSFGTVASAAVITTTSLAPTIPEADYFISALGAEWMGMCGAVVPSSLTILVERLSAEGGMQWEPVYLDTTQTDSEAGVFYAYAQMRTLFKRWPGDNFSDRMDIETARRWRVITNIAQAAGWANLAIMVTYHSITFTAADSISGFTGTVTLGLHRSATGEKVLETTRSGDGAFSFTWYDNTEELFVSADDGTHVGRSADTLAA